MTPPRIRLWPRPSLVRRVTFTLLGAFMLVWAVLLLREYAGFQHELDQRESLQAVARAIATALDSAAPDLARPLIRASETQLNQLRRHSMQPYPGDLRVRVENAAGRRLDDYFPNQPLPPGEPGPEQATLGVQTYWSAIVRTPQWRVQVLEPTLSERRVLALLNAELLPYLLIALPLLILPIWLAVRRGLRPLRQLVETVAQRASDDFSPLKQHSRHAELRPLIDAFNALYAQARTGIARERALVHDAAHELRTPLAVIAAQAHVLTHAEAPPARQQAQAALENAVARASHLVQQLLTLARLENAEPRPMQHTDLIAITRLLMISATPAATAKDIDLALDLGASRTLVVDREKNPRQREFLTISPGNSRTLAQESGEQWTDGDVSQPTTPKSDGLLEPHSPEQLWATLDVSAFHSILENLLANAIAHCPQGTEVRVTLHEHDETLCLAVADNGPGIAPAELPHLFERFRRGPQTPSSGSGLGLAIVRQATERLNGVIKIRTGSLGRGTVFEVRWKNLPANDRPRVTR